MKLSHELGKIFEEEIAKVIQREIDDPDYLPQSDFADSKTPCTDRADHMILDALPAVVNTLALCICTSREQKQSDDTTTEADKLKEGLTEEQIDIGIRSFWND